MILVSIAPKFKNIHLYFCFFEFGADKNAFKTERKQN